MLADQLYGPLPGSTMPAPSTPSTATPSTTTPMASERPAAPKPTGPAPAGDRAPVVLLVAMLGAAVLLTQLTVRGEIEVGL